VHYYSNLCSLFNFVTCKVVYEIYCTSERAILVRTLFYGTVLRYGREVRVYYSTYLHCIHTVVEVIELKAKFNVKLTILMCVFRNLFD